MDKISIIIPVCNVEPYIRKCLDSVIGQTYANLEILLINDGSADNSGNICDEYAARDARVRVFHKENGGVSSARNVGLRSFTGQYVGFVDSDDWIEPDMYEVLHNTITANGVSVSVAGVFTECGAKSVPLRNIIPIPGKILMPDDMLTYIYRLDLYHAFHVVVWNKLYSAKLFLNNSGLVFDEKLISGSDVLFLPRVFLSEGCRGAYTGKPLYHYYQRDASLVHSSPVHIKENGALAAYKAVLKIFNERGYGKLALLVKKQICFYASQIAELAIKTGDKAALERMKAEMRNYFEEYAEVQKEFPERVDRIRKLIGFIMEGG